MQLLAKVLALSVSHVPCKLLFHSYFVPLSCHSLILHRQKNEYQCMLWISILNAIHLERTDGSQLHPQLDSEFVP